MPAHASRRQHTFAEYLEVEEASAAVKHEFVDGEIFAMAGGSVEHAALSNAIAFVLTRHLAGGRCRVFSADLRLRIPSANVATYADAVVVCGPIERDPSSPTHVINPSVVVEVLSPSTADYDREEKRGYCQQLPSLREYVLVSQEARRLEIWTRQASEWTRTLHVAGTTGKLASIDLDLDVDELYRIAGVA